MEKHKNHLTPLGLLLVFGVAVIFLVSFFLIIHTFRNLSRGGFLNPAYHPRQQHNQRKKLRVENIMNWMTFDYINRSFNLPPEYLKGKLNITDKKYPNITIDSWIKKTHQDSNKFLENIKSAINDYLTPPINTPVNSI